MDVCKGGGVWEKQMNADKGEGVKNLKILQTSFKYGFFRI